MGLTASEVYDLAARFGPKKVHEQAKLDGTFIEKHVDVIDQPGQTGYVTLKSGGLAATGYYADGGTLPAGGNVEPNQLYYTPKYLLTRYNLPRGGIDLVQDVKDGVRLLMEQLETGAADVNRTRNRAFFSKKVGTLAANQSTVSSPISLANVAGVRPGATVECYNGSTLFDTNVFDYVDWSTAPSPYDVYLAADTASAWQSGYTLYLRGSKTLGTLSLEDVCAAATLYGHATSSDEWNGNLDSSTTTLSKAALTAMHDQIRNRAGQVDCLVMNPVTATRLQNLSDQDIRFSPGDALDAYGGGLVPTFRGIKIVIDENCGEGDIFFFRKSDVKLHRFRKFGAETDGGKSPGMNMGAAIVSQTSFSYDIQMWEAAELRVLRRNGTGHLSALTA